MVPNPVEFFRNMPPKICVECGNVIEEQHESYMNECEHCLRQVNE